MSFFYLNSILANKVTFYLFKYRIDFTLSFDIYRYENIL
jgi:hypothetical protein